VNVENKVGIEQGVEFRSLPQVTFPVANTVPVVDILEPPDIPVNTDIIGDSQPVEQLSLHECTTHEPVILIIKELFVGGPVGVVVGSVNTRVGTLGTVWQLISGGIVEGGRCSVETDTYT